MCRCRLMSVTATMANRQSLMMGKWDSRCWWVGAQIDALNFEDVLLGLCAIEQRVLARHSKVLFLDGCLFVVGGDAEAGGDSDGEQSAG